jgi:hypothetical protein
MAIEYNWVTEKAQKRTSPLNGLDHVLVSCEWRVTATDGSTILSSYGQVVFDEPSGEDFIDFDQVKQSTILNWVWQTVDRAAVEEELAVRLGHQSQPETIPVAIPKD